MLYNIDDQEMTYMPHIETYERWMRNLPERDFETIISAIHELVDKTPQGQHIITSSYIPGSDWTDKPYLPIYMACGQDWESARLFFGQLVWRAIQLHPEKWYFIRQQRDDDRPIGMTYFRPEGE
jgi:hypothetical protein